MGYKLSILIPSLPNRSIQLSLLISELHKQMYDKYDDVEILTHTGLIEAIGKKRNELLFNSKGEYICFIDDDDEVSSDYIKTLLTAIETKPDCVSLQGCMTTNGQNPELFEHSIRYSEYKTTNNAIKYERYPNHLNCIKASIAKQFKFPEINHGEDTDWATQIHNAGLLKKEYYINKVLYHYKYISNK